MLPTGTHTWNIQRLTETLENPVTHQALRTNLQNVQATIEMMLRHLEQPITNPVENAAQPMLAGSVISDLLVWVVAHPEAVAALVKLIEQLFQKKNLSSF